MNYCILNNKIVKEEKASIPINDDGFLYGFGIYEVIHVFEKKLWNEKAHLKRLENSAKKIGLKVPPLSKKLNELINKNKFDESYLRIDITPQTTLVKQLPIPKFKHVESLITVDCERPLPTIKSTSMLTSFLARKKAKSKNATDALIINSDKYITEAATANLFLIKNKKLLTSISDALPGTTQQLVLQIAKDLGIKIKIKKFKLKQILKADEIFITSTLKFILPINKIDKKVINNGKIGPITKMLQKEFYLKIEKFKNN